MGINDLLQQKRPEILRLAAQCGVRQVRVFGSVARGQAGPDSDVDFLVELEPQATLLDLGRWMMALQELLGRRVDAVTPGGLHAAIRERVLREAVPL